MHTVYVGIGSNLGRPRAHLRAACRALGRLPHGGLEACSALYRSAPVGGPPQADFLNAVARLRTRLAPAVLLRRLQRIEAAHRRRRGVANAPRTLDLDLLLYDRLRLRRAALTLPHPRMHERRFVLQPLLEIAPRIRIPGIGPARGCLARCIGQRVRRLA